MAGHRQAWRQSRRSSILRLLIMVLLIMITEGLLIPSRAQAQDEVQVSSDARSWHPHLDRPLFDPARRWVPGDELTTALWIRNAATAAADLRLALKSIDHDQLLRRGLHLRVRTDDGGWLALPADGSARRLGITLPAGATTRLQVSAIFDPTATNSSQDRRTDLRLRVTLSELTPGSSGAPTRQGPGREGPPGGHPGILAGTGLGAAGLILLLGAAAVGAGVGVLHSSRRGGENHE